MPAGGEHRDRLHDAPRGRVHDAARDRLDDAPRGVALIAHPHPLFGGSLDNKVAQTLAKTFIELGYIALRPNFRGVGASAGEHDEGRGEADDLLAILDYARTRFHAQSPVLAGFSFGAYVQTLVARRAAPERMALVGVAAGLVSGGRSYTAEAVPADSIVIHGELDETVPLANVLAWARPQELPVIVVPGADHFFHRRLNLIKSIIKGAWQR
ncbi:MAG: alpha/beta hydrolase [Betaproteobacteria bacterium RIFCSPLOWO2_12_FULL_64_23]|nr:MAG: alpha/beta hydrolase [Betaproteobacteria bacterium RIFCSPLOWO2_12_FULL_64_23]